MGLIYDNWLWLWNHISPQVDSRQIEAILAEAKQSLPTPVFWMLGKVQQGKTSIIRALSGRNDAEIGKGFRACTRTSRAYAYPNEEGCFLQFLDTRGLGEVGYDPAEDLEVFADQSHYVIVVLSAMDHAQQDVLDALRTIRKQRPQWPVVVCQTTLHAGYAGEAGHIVPYPYDENPLPDSVPHELARSLLAQREWFDKEPVRFVPLDFTFADHGQRVYEPADYGLDALWRAIEAAMPLGLREMVRNNIAVRKRLHDTYFDAAHPHVLVYAGAAGGAGAIPVPYIDVPVVLAIQAKLFHTIGAIYGQPMNVQQMATIASGLGIGYFARFGVRELAKLIPLPGVGSAISGAFAMASTYGLGIALCEYFGHVRDGNVPDAKLFRGWYQEAFAAAKQRFRKTPPAPSNAKGTSP
jgi:uncharacterized protein (DUF697 family)/DNA-binding NarL/FixJ family response regulator